MRGIKNSIRFFYIGYVLARYDALFLLPKFWLLTLLLTPVKLLAIGHWHRRRGERLCRALTRLGPTFIKFGQALSTRPDLVGDEIAADLSVLQDSLPPFAFRHVRRTLEADLQKPLDEVYAAFDKKPVAAASIAQVHFAEDKEGNLLAVKVLRPGIGARFEKDIDLLLWLAELVTRRAPATRRLKLVEAVQLFADSSRMELDLRYEAAAAAELKENFKNDAGFKVPSVDWHRTSQHVLTLERVDGTSVYKADELAAQGHDLDRLIAKAGEVFFKQVFRDGFFHADMHPGNVFINGKGEIVVVDFGIMGRVDRKTRMYLAEMLKGFFERDYTKVSRVHFEAGYVPATESPERFAQACRAIAEPIFGLPQNDISIGRLLAQLFKVTREFNMETQPQLLLLQKTLVMAEGLGRMLNPSVNIWQMSAPYIQEWATSNLGAKARAMHAAEDVKDMLSDLKTAFSAARHLASAVTPEGIRLHPDTVASLKKRPSGCRLKWALKMLALLVVVGCVSGTVSILVFLALTGSLTH